MSAISSVLFVGHFEILDELADLCSRLGVGLRLAFGPRQLSAWQELAQRSPVVEEILSAAIIAESFDEVVAELHLDESWLVVSMGSPFIFKKRHIELLGGKIINSHAAPLPEHGGGGGMSWRIMSGDLRGVVLLHEVTEGIDQGNILARVDFEFPSGLRSPQEYMDHAQPIIRDRAIELVGSIVESGALPASTPQTGNPTYYPRLATTIHGAIDWRWSADEIVRFVRAFAAPNPGAFTTCRGTLVTVLTAEVIYWSSSLPHPFMSGIIVAADGDGWIVAVREGYIRVGLGSNNDAAPQLGDRLSTTSEQLDKAMSTRVEYLPRGMREQRPRT